jgi:hypothetical protein
MRCPKGRAGSNPAPGTQERVGGGRDDDHVTHVRDQLLVDTALLLSDLNVTDRDTAAICGVAVNTDRRWRRLYQRRGLPRGQQHTAVPCSRCTGGSLDPSAYAHLLGWYLGDGHIVRARRDVYLLTVVNDSRYVENSRELAESMRRVKPGGRVHERMGPGCRITALGWKHWPCLFPQHGPGRKHDRPIVLEAWQRQVVEEHPGRFVRGLFHSDGCRVTNRVTRQVAGERKQYSYARYLFSNRSQDILGLCEWALDLLGVAHRRSNRWNVSVARREAVAVLDQVVGPKA